MDRQKSSNGCIICTIYIEVAFWGAYTFKGTSELYSTQEVLSHLSEIIKLASTYGTPAVCPSLNLSNDKAFNSINTLTPFVPTVGLSLFVSS